jgi:uncharacterized protein (PEP-CTERM system associated)
MIRITKAKLTLCTALMSGGLVLAAPALAQSGAPQKQGDTPHLDITPYIEIDQTVLADFTGGETEVSTYTSLAAGVDTSIYNRRFQGQLSARYERQISWQDGESDQDYVSALANINAIITPGLNWEVGGIASRTRVDSRGSVPNNFVGVTENVSRVYSAYTGPTLVTNVGEMNVSAGYRVGYTRVESQDNGTATPGVNPVDIFDDSINHAASFSAGMQPGTLPVGWAIGAGYNREDAGQLDQRYEDIYARLDLTLPITGSLALVGGVGFEKVEVSERDALRDGVGLPVYDANGRLITDNASPRLTSFETDGLIFDAGVMWRPSRRTSVEARVGRRYDSTTYYGSLAYAPNDRTSVGVSVYDELSGFGSQLNNSIAGLGGNFSANRNPLSGELTGCALGGGGGALCFGPALQSANSAMFRARGVTASLSTRVGGWDFGYAMGYQNRKYQVSAIGGQSQLRGQTDETYFASLSASRQVGQNGSFGTSVYGNYYLPALAADGTLGVGANAYYGQELLPRLSLNVAAGLDTYQRENFDTEISASGLIGLRYGF